MAGTVQGALEDGLPRAGRHLCADQRGNGPLGRSLGGSPGRLARGGVFRCLGLGLRAQTQDNAAVRASGGREQADDPGLCPVGGLVRLRRLGDFSVSVDRDGYASEVGIEVLRGEMVKRRRVRIFA